MLPSSQNVEKMLYFNDKEVLYTNKGMEKDQNFESNENNQQIRITFKVPETAMYTNLENKTFINETFILDKQFLVEDKVIPYKWQITGEQKMILGYPCQKAVFQDEKQEIIAWFTPKIPVSAGPNDINGLPGLTLLAEYPKRNRAIIAESLEALPQNFKFEIPTQGKKVRKAEFDKIKEEKDKEMGAQGGTRVKIITTEERQN
jgi:GLPGLI family protein